MAQHAPSASLLLYVGDVTLDLTMALARIPEPDEKVHADRAVEAPGGVVTNAAAACAKAGARVRLALRLGTDAASARVRADLEAAGLEVAAEEVPGPLSRVVVLIEPHGEKRLILEPGVSMFPGAAMVERLSLHGVAHVHTAVYGTAAPRLVERCRDAGIGWSIDLEPASFADGIASLAPMVRGAAVIFLNQRAARAIGGDAEAALLAMGARRVVSTLGPMGARYRDARGTLSARPPAGLPVIDTTGAGDCLAGWFLAGLTSGLAPEHNLARAVAAASVSCGSLGAQASYPLPASLPPHLPVTESPS